jgi:hypothetical protein
MSKQNSVLRLDGASSIRTERRSSRVLTNPVQCATSLGRVWGVMNYSVLQPAGMGLCT